MDFEVQNPSKMLVLTVKLFKTNAKTPKKIAFGDKGPISLCFSENPRRRRGENFGVLYQLSTSIYILFGHFKNNRFCTSIYIYTEAAGKKLTAKYQFFSPFFSERECATHALAVRAYDHNNVFPAQIKHN